MTEEQTAQAVFCRCLSIVCEVLFINPHRHLCETRFGILQLSVILEMWCADMGIVVTTLLAR